MTRTSASSMPRAAATWLPHAEGHLGPGPHRQPATVPLGQGGSGLQRDVGDVRGRIGRSHRRRRRGRSAPATSPVASSIAPLPALASVTGGCAGTRRGPRRSAGGHSHSASMAATARRAVAGSSAATPTNEPSSDDRDPGHPRGRVSRPNRSVAPGTGGRSTAPWAIPGPVEVGHEPPATGDGVEAGGLVPRRPTSRRSRGRCEARLGVEHDDPTAVGDGSAPPRPAEGGAGAGSGPTQRLAGVGHGAAAERADVVGAEVGVALDDTDDLGTRRPAPRRRGGGRRSGCPGQRRPCR